MERGYGQGRAAPAFFGASAGKPAPPGISGRMEKSWATTTRKPLFLLKLFGLFLLR
jgi:hypothetical protein